eukprot:scaffold2436_cov249-Pinguiococcus_pyrenoidosus.AAC.8
MHGQQLDAVVADAAAAQEEGLDRRRVGQHILHECCQAAVRYCIHGQVELAQPEHARQAFVGKVHEGGLVHATVVQVYLFQERQLRKNELYQHFDAGHSEFHALHIELPAPVPLPGFLHPFLRLRSLVPHLGGEADDWRQPRSRTLKQGTILGAAANGARRSCDQWVGLGTISTTFAWTEVDRDREGLETWLTYIEAGSSKSFQWNHAEHDDRMKHGDCSPNIDLLILLKVLSTSRSFLIFAPSPPIGSIA